MSNILPKYARKYFWGDDLNELNWQDHQQYIVQTLLERGDVEAIAWLFQQLSKEEICEIVGKVRLSPKSRNFWITYLG